MKKLMFLSLICIAGFATHGSLMTNSEEANALASNATVKEAIQTARGSYCDALDQYRNGSITFSALENQYASIFSGLLQNVQKAIQDDTTGTISPIAEDYDGSHQKDYQKHLQKLIGLVQGALNIPTYQCLLPPSNAYKNLLTNGDFSQGITGWSLSSGSAKLVVNPAGTIDSTSPVANKGSLTLTDVPSRPGYASVSQTVSITPGNTYLIAGYVLGTPPEGNGAYSGGIDVTGVRFLKSSITGKTKHYPQVFNEIDEEGLHRIYYWVTAEGDSLTVSLSGGEKTSFKYIGVYDITADADQAMALSQKICPPPTTLGNPEAGQYPQVEHTMALNENLLDGGVSFQENIDQSALKNAGHPYWYIDGHNPANLGIKFVNGLNGAHAISMPASSSITTNGPIPCPTGSYKLSANVFVPENSNGKIKLELSGTDLINSVSLPKVSQELDGLTAGEWNTVFFKINDSMFAEMAKGCFFRPTVTITNGGDAVIVADTSLIPYDTNCWTLINAVNPYASTRSWYQEGGAEQSYDFTQDDISLDWGVALTGNTMFAPGSPPIDFTSKTAEGIELKSIYDQEAKPPYANGGIQSTQMIPSGHPFSIQMTFTANSDGSGYQPTVALWTYGESQRGPASAMTHTNAPGTDPITEFDCEMGSDVTPKVPPQEGKLCIRDGSYIGHAFGGHSEYTDTDAQGNDQWKVVPDFWDGKQHVMVMKGYYNSDGRFTLERSLDGETYSTQDLGKGPFGPMYIKIATENPNWNSRGHIKGTAHVVIHSVDVKVSPLQVIKGNSVPTIANDQIDYTWFTPGGGGSISYCPFPRSCD